MPALDETGDAGERLKAVIEGYALSAKKYTTASTSRHSILEAIRTTLLAARWPRTPLRAGKKTEHFAGYHCDTRARGRGRRERYLQLFVEVLYREK